MSAIEKQPKPHYTLEDVHSTTEGDELLEELYEDVESGVSRYFESVLAHERSAVMSIRTDREATVNIIEVRDEARRRSHNALQDRLRILARTVVKAKRSAEWWNGPHGLQDNRDAVSEWALKEAFDKMKKRVKKEEELANA